MIHRGMIHRYRGVNVGGERHFQRHINCPPSKSVVHTPPSKRGHSRCACIDASLRQCRRNTIIRAVHALMPTCVCVVAIPSFALCMH